MKFKIHKADLGPNASDADREEAKDAPIFYWFTIVAANGETMATSETYTRKQTARDTIAAIVNGCNGDGVGQEWIRSLIADETGEG